MKLTAQIAAAYFGCEVYTYSGIGNLSEISANGHWFVSLKSGGATVGNLNDDYTPCPDGPKESFPKGYPPKSILKLRLTPLSEISDEDAEYVAHVCGVPKRDRIAWGKEVIANWRDAETSRALDISGEHWQIITDYLRASEWNGKPKQAYDCGHGEIKSLIEAGIAFKK